MRPKRLSPFALPTLILLLAFALRVYHLDHHAIWGDEAFSVAVGKLPLAQVVAGGTDTHPPLFHTLLHYWMPLAGDSPFAVRFLSVIPGMLLVATIYALGRRLLGERAGLLAAGLAAISSFAVYYSQEARMYSLAAAFTALSVYTFLRLIDAPDARLWSRKSRFWLAAYLVTTLAAMYSHYYVFFVIAAENLYALWKGWKHKPWPATWIGMQVVLAIAYLPWVSAQTGYLSGRANTRLDAWGPSGMQDVWMRALIAFGGGTHVPADVKWAALGLTLPVALGIIDILGRRTENEGKVPGSAVFLVLYLVVPMLIAWLVGPIMPFFYERFLLVAFPAYLLLLAAGLMAMGRRRSPLLVLGGLGLALTVGINIYSLNNTYHDPAYAKSGYNRLMAYVAQNAQPGDAFLLLNPEQRYLYDYYGFTGIPAYWFPPPAPWDDPATQSTMDDIEAQHERLWLVLFGNAYDWDFGQGLQNWLSAHTFRAYHGDYVDGGLELHLVGDVQPSEPIDARFAGAIRLTGYGMSGMSIIPGGALQVALAWEALQEMDRDYTIFVHLVDDEQHIWGQMDSPPAGGNRPTSTWQVGETSVDRLAFQVDPETPPGTYRLQAGWYELATLERLPAVDATGNTLGDHVVLAQITVE
ncbi:MAG: glycosyltransferase family 39 protein [Anaerolineae bacterium]|nr:glycosyltransferase family 39 protein [Anaerolineae bacterium]